MSEIGNGQTDEVLQALHDVQRTMTTPSVLPRWVRSMAKEADDEYLAKADQYLIDLRPQERAVFAGGKLSGEQARHASRLLDLTVDYAAGLGVDVSEQVFPIDSDNIGYYTTAEYAAISRKFPYLQDAGGFNSPFTHFIGVRVNRNNKGADWIITQHEMLHRLGVKQYMLVENDNGTTGIRCWRSGWNFGPDGADRFGFLDEANIISMTDEMRQTLWKDTPELAPFADAVDYSISRNAILGNTTHEIGVICRAFFKAMCDRAADITGEDVKTKLHAGHFSGDDTALHLLSGAFGNKALTLLSSYDATKPPGEGIGILDVVDHMGLRSPFIDELYSYKKMATRSQLMARLVRSLAST